MLSVVQKLKREYLYIFIITAAAAILVADLFLIPGRGISFDGHIHMTTIAQFAQALSEGEFPVRWSNNFANYGLPLPILAHQLPIYLGAFLELLINNPVMSFNVVMLVGAVLSALFTYAFFRKYTNPAYATIGAIFFNFAPYRIINIYIRGALPELFASLFLPVVLLGIVSWFRDKQAYGIALTLVGLVGLALSHPMVLLTSSLIFVPLALYYSWPWHQRIIALVKLALVGALAAGLAGYYLLPLILEAKYFYFGNVESLLAGSAFLSWENFVSADWYFFKGHPGPRGDFMKLGWIEAVLLLLSFAITVKSFWQEKRIKLEQLLVIMAAGLVILMLPAAEPLYTTIPFLDKLQFPWRMLGSLIFLPAFLLVLLLDKYFTKDKRKLGLAIGVLVLSLVFFLRIPQLYTKNSTVYDHQHYYFIQTNLHTQNLNPIWSGNSDDYPVKTEQYGVIEGEATITPIALRNSSREYQLEAKTASRLVDYTFYFPGWQVLVDGAQTPIEFQDPNYRGLITYQVPAGEHQVTVEYKPTKVRLLAYAITIFSFIGLVMGLVFYQTSSKVRQLVDPS